MQKRKTLREKTPNFQFFDNFTEQILLSNPSHLQLSFCSVPRLSQNSQSSIQTYHSSCLFRHPKERITITKHPAPRCIGRTHLAKCLDSCHVLTSFVSHYYQVILTEIRENNKRDENTAHRRIARIRSGKYLENCTRNSNQRNPNQIHYNLTLHSI